MNPFGQVPVIDDNGVVLSDANLDKAMHFATRIQNELARAPILHAGEPIFLAVSEKRWDSWDDATKAAMSKAAQEAMSYQVEITREATASGLEKLKAEGMEVTELSPEALQAFRDATKAPFDQWSAKVGPDLVALFQDTITSSGK